MDYLRAKLREIRRRAFERQSRGLDGRFSYAAAIPRNTGIYIRLTQDERERIRWAAAATGKTVTETIIHAVEKYTDNEAR